MSKKDNILERITEFYLESGDFNGLPVRNIVQVFRLEESQLKSILTALIREDKISLAFGDIQPNPHIKAFWAEPKEKQAQQRRAVKEEELSEIPFEEIIAAEKASKERIVEEEGRLKIEPDAETMYELQKKGIVIF